MTFKTVQEAIDTVEFAMKQSDEFLRPGSSAHIANHMNPERSSLLKMKGLSSQAVRVFFNCLCGKKDARYLEVGTYTGSSLISACFNNPLKRAVGIDDWSMDKTAKPKLLATLDFFKKNLLVTPELIEAEAFGMDKSELGQFDIYFYDGHHSADSQEKGLTKFWGNLAPISIVIVDDYSVFRVQQGTIRAIDKLGCKQHLKYAWTLPGGKGFEHLYWGGLAVMVIEK